MTFSINFLLLDFLLNLLVCCIAKYFDFFSNKNEEVVTSAQLRRVTTGGIGGEVSPALFQNLKKSALILGKNALTRFIYGFHLSFKMLF